MLNKKQGSGFKIPDNDRRGFIKQAFAACFYSVLPFKNRIMTKAEGVTIIKSRYNVKETIDRLQQFLQQHGATIYARINQQQELSNADQTIATMEFILFGNPKAGGPAIVENPVAALDLPLKILAWQDAQQIVWVAYNNVGYIKNRYALSAAVSAPLNLEPLIAQMLIQ